MKRTIALPIDMFIPEKRRLAAIVQNELSTDFEEATVEWVDCPDLTQDPFYLAAPGICGDTAILNIGSKINVFPQPQKEKIYYFDNILQELNRTQSDNFILGGGYYAREPDKYLGELIMNASFLSYCGRMTLRNKSRFAYWKIENTTNRESIVLEPLTNTNLYCNMHGNFFVSKGLREQVLKVYAKKRFGQDFIDALQSAIQRFAEKTTSQLVGFGGIFIIRNGRTVQHLIRNDWNDLHNCFKHYSVENSVKRPVGFTTFISSTKDHFVDMKPTLNAIPNLRFKNDYKILTNWIMPICVTQWHAYSYSNTYGGGQYHETERNNYTEYLGYFSPVSKYYHIDPAPIL